MTVLFADRMIGVVEERPPVARCRPQKSRLALFTRRCAKGSVPNNAALLIDKPPKKAGLRDCHNVATTERDAVVERGTRLRFELNSVLCT
jgi:hypothetical protein